MAAYREHITVSGFLGMGYGVAAALSMGFSPVQGALAGVATWVAGMLPDLDADNGKPIREIFALLAAVVPLTIEHRIAMWTGSLEQALLLGIVIYAVIRYGGAALLSRITVHRGMLHSIPAGLLFAELAFLGYESDSQAVKLLMAGGVLLGFLSHLVLDEIYSVGWSGVTIKLNKAAGSALKLFGKNAAANVLTYSLLAGLTWFVLNEEGLLQDIGDPNRNPFRQAVEDDGTSRG